MQEHIVPINTAEAIFAPFYEPYVDLFKTWRLTLNDAVGAACSTTWGNVSVQWNAAAGGEHVMTAEKPVNLPCRGYDRLIIHAQLSQTSAITLSARTDRGEREVTHRSKPFGMEYILELGEAECLEMVRIRLDTTDAGLGWCGINWMMLQSSERLPAYEAMWKQYGKDWSWHLNLDATDIAFLPQQEIIFSKERIRELQDRPEFRDPESPLAKLAAYAMTLRPEDYIAETINLGFDLRFARDRDGAKFLVGHGDAVARRGDQVGQLSAYPTHLALVAAARKDIDMARHAARFVASILMCPNWHQSFQCIVPGVCWDHRSYTQSLIAFNIVTVVDLFSELFTDLTKEVVLRRLAIDVIGQTNWTMYKWDYIFSNNSLQLFTVGRMAAAVHVSKTLPRAEVEIDKAYDHAAANMENLIQPDGGYDEGPGYLNEMLRAYLMAMHVYARAKGKPFEECLHPNILKSNNYVEAVMSTDESRYFLPICDGARTDQDFFDHFGLMTQLMPQSIWAYLYRKYRAQNQGLPTEVFDLLAAPDPDTFPAYTLKPWIALPHTGYVSSLRRLDDEWVKVFIMGSKADAGHVHDDIGSFILEFAGDTFAMDAGMSNYSHPDGALLKRTRYHNMLIPFDGIETLKRGFVERRASNARGHGDTTAFEAEITPATRHADFREWTRQWRSTSPDRLDITDTYALTRGDGVEFLWNTQLPVTLDGHQVTIQGRRGRVILTTPEDCTLECRELPHYSGRPIHQVAIRKSEQQGTLAVSAGFTHLSL